MSGRNNAVPWLGATPGASSSASHNCLGAEITVHESRASAAWAFTPVFNARCTRRQTSYGASVAACVRAFLVMAFPGSVNHREMGRAAGKRSRAVARFTWRRRTVVKPFLGVGSLFGFFLFGVVLMAHDCLRVPRDRFNFVSSIETICRCYARLVVAHVR